MTLLAAHPSLDYGAVRSQLAMPVGSLGPTRAHSPARLRGTPN